MAITTLRTHSSHTCSQFKAGGLFAHILSDQLPRLTTYTREDVPKSNAITTAQNIILDIHLIYYMYAALPIIDNPFHGILRSLAMVPPTHLFTTRWTPRLAVAWAAAITLDGFGRELGDLTYDQVLSCDTTTPMLLRRHQAIGDYLGYTPVTNDESTPTTPAPDLLNLAIEGRLNPSQELQLIHALPLLIELIQRSSLPLSSTQVLSLASYFPNTAYQLLSLLLDLKSPLYDAYIKALPDLALNLPSLELVLRIVQGRESIKGNKVDGKEMIVRPYLANCIKWINEMSDEEDIMGSTTLLCHLITRLLDTDNLDPLDDLDTAEINEFLLSHSKYTVATVVYKRLLEDRQ